MKRKRSRRKPNFYRPIRTQDDVDERTRQMRAGGKHDQPKPRQFVERLARDDQDDSF